jgi:hypothetical protein
MNVTTLLTLFKYSQPLYLTSWLLKWMWERNRKNNTHDPNEMLMKQEKSLEMLEYQLLFLTREIKKLKDPGKETEWRESDDDTDDSYEFI